MFLFNHARLQRCDEEFKLPPFGSLAEWKWQLFGRKRKLIFKMPFPILSRKGFYRKKEKKNIHEAITNTPLQTNPPHQPRMLYNHMDTRPRVKGLRSSSVWVTWNSSTLRGSFFFLWLGRRLSLNTQSLFFCSCISIKRSLNKINIGSVHADIYRVSFSELKFTLKWRFLFKWNNKKFTCTRIKRNKFENKRQKARQLFHSGRKFYLRVKYE